MASTNPKVAPTNKQEFRDFVKEFNDFELLDSISCYRKIYRDVMSDGISVLEQNIDEKAKKEAADFISEVLKNGN